MSNSTSIRTDDQEEGAVTTETRTPAQQAVDTYIARQQRLSHPAGKWDGPRWVPTAAESRECCQNIRPPSRQWPYSLMTHCRTLEHVCRLSGVDIREARAELRTRRQRE